VTATTLGGSVAVGATTAFEDFYLATFSDLAGYGWSLTGDPHLGDELAQEALTRVYARWALLREPRPYAYRIVTNLARDLWSRTSRELLGDSGPESAVLDPDSSLLDAVRRLDPRLRDVVLLHYFADLPLAEIAHALRRPLGTVKRRLHEARAALALSLEDTR
jgi:RNA polymerase sigma-70 factor (ECF subfamily)